MAFALIALGGCLQLLGISLVGKGISRRRVAYGRPSFLEDIKTDLRRLWDRLRGRPTTLQIAHGTSAIISSLGSVTARGRARVSGQTVEQRLERLEDQVDRLDEQDYELERKLEAEKREREAAIAAEVASRSAAMSELGAKIESLATEDLSIERWGVVSFFVGIGLQTLGGLLAR